MAFREMWCPQCATATVGVLRRIKSDDTGAQLHNRAPSSGPRIRSASRPINYRLHLEGCRGGRVPVCNISEEGKALELLVDTSHPLAIGC